MTQVVVLISGRGSNLQALLAALPGRIAAVVSNEPDARGLDLARAANVPSLIVAHREFPDRLSFDRALAKAIDAHRPKLVVLAGFMRILTDWFVERYAGRLINIHPSLLPAFPGTQTHRRALEEGVRVHGATVHFVTAALDHGPIVIQAAVPVLQADSQQTLAARVLEQEHRILPLAARWFLEGRLHLEGNRVRIDGALPAQLVLICPENVR